MSSVPFISTPEALRQLAAKAHAPCQCSLQHCDGWESINDTAWPAQQMTHVATLRDPDVHDPTFEEHHPNGTRYESADAPVKVKTLSMGAPGAVARRVTKGRGARFQPLSLGHRMGLNVGNRLKARDSEACCPWCV